jgi:Nucleotidyl transferase AbiEii toxin, Type IV TA system
MDDRATAQHYSDPMSEQLLGMAADVLRSFGSAFGGRHLAIVGGAVPSLLVGNIPPGMEPHVGTADLDLHLSLHLLDGETADYYDAIIDGLTEMGLAPDTREDGREVKWRWIGSHRGVRLQVEFLCPVRSRGGLPEQPAVATAAEKNIGPAGQITALSVGFGHLVPVDTVTVDRVVETSRGRLRFEFPVAGVASWLCLKSDAIMRRDKPKDAYDVVWLIAGLGPEAAARSVLESPLMQSEFDEEVRSQLARLAEQFADDNSVGARSYVDFMASGNEGTDCRFAVGAVSRFVRLLELRLA